MRTTRRARGSGESGFALLLIFVLAAGIAIAMMTQLPRVCFETQRDREQTLIERGEQYKRAIALYVRKWNKYPGRIEDLENTNGIRYLRRRYVDPMTGKDDWRMIHAGPGGALTDSLVQKSGAVGPDGKPLQSGMPGSTGMNNPSGMNNANGMNANPGNSAAIDPNSPPEVNQAVKARPSDRMPGQVAAGAQGDPSQQYQQSSFGYPPPPPPPDTQYPAPVQPGYQQQPMGQPGYQQVGQPGYQQVVQQPMQQMSPDQQGQFQPMQPGSQQPGQVVGQPADQNGMVRGGLTGYPQPVQPGQPGYQTPQGQVVPGQVPPPLYPAQPGQAIVPPNQFQGVPGVVPNQPGNFRQPGIPQYQQPGAFPGVGQNGAQQVIQQILTQPRQLNGGFNNPGVNTVNQSGGFNSTTPNQGGFSTGPSSFNNQSQGGMNSGLGAGGNQGMGAGIAGVATKYKGPSIKVYAERKKYQEWEFVFDPRQDALKKMGGVGAGNNPGNQPGSGQTGTQSGFGQGGSQSGFGQSSFGQSGGQSTPGASPAQPAGNPPN